MKSSKSITELSFIEYKNGSYLYLRAYRNKWVPAHVREDGTQVKGQTRAEKAHQCGKRLPDGRVLFSPRFLEKFPAFKEDHWFFVKGRTDLVDEEMFFDLRERGEIPETTPADEVPSTEPHEPAVEAPKVECKNFLAHYALRSLAYAKSIPVTLRQVLEDSGDLKASRLAKQNANRLLDLAIYSVLRPGQSADCYEEWAQEQFLPETSAKMKGQDISKLFQSITRKNWDEYWRARFERSQELHRQAHGKRPVRLCAFDSTSISTYGTWDTAAEGHNKENDQLPQINLALVCDQQTCEPIYALPYNGSINDVASYKYIVERMKTAGFPVHELLFVTDRGYPSNGNINKLIQDGVPFLTGCRVRQQTADLQWLKDHKDGLMNSAAFQPLIGSYCHTREEKWTSGSLTISVYVHTYIDPAIRQAQCSERDAQVCQIVDAKNAGKSVDDWVYERYKRFIIAPDPKKGRRKWQINTKAIDEARLADGVMVIRTNRVREALPAMQLYRMRGVVEACFSQFKSQLDARRLRVRQSTYLGKLLVLLIGLTLRMGIRQNYDADQLTHQSPKLEMPGGSIAKLLLQLDHVKLYRARPDDDWLLDPLPKKAKLWLARIFKATPPPERTKDF